MAALDRRIPAAQTVRLEGTLDVSALPIKPALRYFLVRRADRVLATGAYRRLGSWYELDHRPYDYSIYVADRSRPPVRGAAVVSRAEYTDGWGHHVVTVWMRSARSARLDGHRSVSSTVNDHRNSQGGGHRLARARRQRL
jgi:hypothetical protein